MPAIFRPSLWFASKPRTFKSSTLISGNSLTTRVLVSCN